MVQRVKQDPLCWHGGVRTLQGHVILTATDALLDGKLLKSISTPVILFQGEKDQLVSPEGAPFFHDNVGSRDKRLLTYPEAYHNLYVELEEVKAVVIHETCDWIVKHL